MRDTFIAQLKQRAVGDPRIMLITGDLGFGVFDRYREDCPKQFLNAGIAEQNMTMVATGMALEGRIVFTYSIGNFSTLRCLEQIRNDACYHNTDVKIVSIGGGFSYGALGISHHATEDLAIMRALPNMTVVAPCGLWEAKQATDALIDTPGTFFLRLDKSSGCDEPLQQEEVFRLGRARILKEGTDVAIIVTGGILGEVQKAADILEFAGVSVKIVSVHTIKPFDVGLVLDIAREIKTVVTVEEHTVIGGLGSAVAETLLDNGVQPKAFLRIGLGDRFSSMVGSQAYLRQQYGLDASAIAGKIRKLI